MQSSNFYKSLRPLYLIGIPLGLSPYIITHKGEILLNKRSTWQTLFALIFSIVSIIALILTFRSTQAEFESILQIVMVMGHALWQYLTIFIILIEYCHRKRFVMILDKLRETFDTFNIANTTNRRKVLRANSMFAIRGFVLIFILSTFSQYNFTTRFATDLEKLVVSMLVYVSLYFVLPVVILKFMTLNYCITKGIQMMNEDLEDNVGVKLKRQNVSIAFC